MRKILKVFAATAEDIHQGWVWLHLPGIEPRSIIKITNIEKDKSVYCEALQIDKNYLNHYNVKCGNVKRFKIDDQNRTIVINNWYRKKLEIDDTQCNVELEIAESMIKWHGKIMACFHHPQIIIRQSAWLSVISLILGILGFITGMKDFFSKLT